MKRRDYSSPLWSLLMFDAFLRKNGEPTFATPPSPRAVAPDPVYS